MSQAGQLELSWRRGFVGSVTDCSCCLGSIGKQKKVYQELFIIFVVFKNVILAPVVVGDSSVYLNHWC